MNRKNNNNFPDSLRDSYNLMYPNHKLNMTKLVLSNKI